SCAMADTDDVVATNVGVPVSQYLREHGEVDFRERELEALREVLGTDAVVATGAGIVVTSAARELLTKEPTYWIDSGDETLLERVSEGERPLLGDDHRQGIAKL